MAVTKLDKIKEMLLLMLTPADTTLRALRERADLSMLIDTDPNFSNDMRRKFAMLAASVFEPMSEGALDAAIAFYRTPAALEMKHSQLAGVKKMAEAMKAWMNELQTRIGELAKKNAS